MKGEADSVSVHEGEPGSVSKRQVLTVVALLVIASGVVVGFVLPSRYTCGIGQHEIVDRVRVCVPTDPRAIADESSLQRDDRVPLRIAAGMGAGAVGLVMLGGARRDTIRKKSWGHSGPSSIGGRPPPIGDPHSRP